MALLREAEGDRGAALVLLAEAERLYIADFSPNVRPVPAMRARVLAATLVEEGDAVVAIGTGAATRSSGDVHRFAYCDVFTFAAGSDSIRRVESYLVPLGQQP